MSRLVLTADQIYAMAYILKAKYLDYFYISLSNRSDDNKLWLSEMTKQLVSLGVLVEDFSGETSIDPNIEKLVNPLFFSNMESSLDINIFGDEEDNSGYRFHFLDGNITLVRSVEEGFEISETSPDEIKDLVSSIISSDYTADSSKVDMTFDSTKVSRIIVAKNTDLSVGSVVLTFVESDGVIYEEDIDDNVFSVSKDDFIEKLNRVLTEV